MSTLKQWQTSRALYLLSVRKKPDSTFLANTEKRLIVRTRGIFQKQMDWIVTEMEKLSFFGETQQNTLDDEILDFMSYFPHQVDLTEQIIAVMQVSLARGAKQSIKKMKLGKFGVSFSLKNPEAIALLGGKLSHELSQKQGTIHDTTVQAISKILKEAANSGQSYQETARQIIAQGDEGVFSRARAELIATREVGIAYESGKKIPVSEFQRNNPDTVVKKFWQTVEDLRVTDPHKQNQKDGWILLQERFSGTGDDISPGSDNPRCRCFTKYQIT